jgi:hypothetical protein
VITCVNEMLQEFELLQLKLFGENVPTISTPVRQIWKGLAGGPSLRRSCEKSLYRIISTLLDEYFSRIFSALVEGRFLFLLRSVAGWNCLEPAQADPLLQVVCEASPEQFGLSFR